jgi:hypothetical protein
MSFAEWVDGILLLLDYKMKRQIVVKLVVNPKSGSKQGLALFYSVVTGV